MSRRAAASSPAPSPPKGRRCPAAARPSSAPPWPRRSSAAGCRVQGVGNRVEREETALPFLGGRTSRLANLRRGATQGRPSRGAVRPGHPECGPGSFRAGRSGRGRGGRPLGGELPGQHLRGGPTPWTASRNSCSGRRKDPPSSSAAAPLHLLCFLLLPRPRFSADCRARFVLAPAWPLQSHRSLQQLAQSATGFLAAHSSRHRESGPTPGEGAAGKLESGLNRLRRGSRTSTQPRAPPGAKVLHRHPPGPPPKKTWSRQKPGAHAMAQKKSLLRILGSSEPAQEALAAFPLARAPPSGPSRPRSAARSG